MTFHRTPWTSDQPVTRRLPTRDNTTQKNTHASSGTRAHDPSNQVAKTYALDRAVTGAG
jgi:hypothetical protein